MSVFVLGASFVPVSPETGAGTHVGNLSECLGTVFCVWKGEGVPSAQHSDRCLSYTVPRGIVTSPSDTQGGRACPIW